MFPPLSPNRTGHLPVGQEGDTLYWEESGNPRGKAALYLHGGPGGGIMTGYRRRFDPDVYRIVSFEQRGCGRSRPLVIDALSSLSRQTTSTLIVDIEALREHLGVDRWLVSGVSWGTTLALAYAQAHPDRVTALVLVCVGLTSAREVEWITETMGRVFPREWERFRDHAQPREGQRLVDAYYERLLDPDPLVRDAAARAWCAWEDVHVSLDPQHQPDPHYEDPVYRGVFATLTAHYWKHAAFLPEGALLAGMARIAHLPGALIHGRLDVSSPLDTVLQLHRAWPGSTLEVIDHEGHGGPSMMEAQAEAISRLADA